MAITATVRTWHADRGWGVLDCPQTPGGCWAHVSSIHRPGPWDLQPGQEYVLEWEAADQDGFAYRALRMWPVGTDPLPPATNRDRTAYRSTLTLSFDDD